MATQRHREQIDLLSKAECAEELRLSVRSVEKLIQSGSLAAIKWGGCVRIERSELHAFLERHRLVPNRKPVFADRGDSRRTGPSSYTSSKHDLRLARDVAEALRAQEESA
jgi:excisionase family DNA binding protein